MVLVGNESLNSLVLSDKIGEAEKDGQKAAALKEDVELNRQEAKDNRLDKVRVSSFSFDLPMLGILLTHPYPRHHLPPVDLLTWEYISAGDRSLTPSSGGLILRSTIIHRQAALFGNGRAGGSTAGLVLVGNESLNSLDLCGKIGEAEKDGQKAAALKEDVELNREEAKDNRLDKVRVSSFSFDLPMLGILLTLRIRAIICPRSIFLLFHICQFITAVCGSPEQAKMGSCWSILQILYHLGFACFLQHASAHIKCTCFKFVRKFALFVSRQHNNRGSH